MGLISEDIIQYLEGSCHTIEQASENFNTTREEIEEVLKDSDIECCYDCGWWFDIAEMHHNGEGICVNCQEQYDEEED